MEQGSVVAIHLIITHTDFSAFISFCIFKTSLSLLISTMDHLSAMLEEASDIANVNLDLEPFSVDETLSTSPSAKRTVHKAGKSNSACVKKTWKKPADKPKRPLSAYNIFFQHEREKIITNNPEITLEAVLFKIKNTIKPKKRRHRKSHGMIGFAQLARTIAETWKALDEADKSPYEAKAAIEKAKYREDLEEWARAREEKAKEDEKKTPMELARVEVVHEDDHFAQTAFHHQSAHHIHDKSALDKFGHQSSQHDTLSALLMNANSMRNPLSQPQQSDVRDYLSMTQKTLDMARASLSLPLFANLQVQQQNAAAAAGFPPVEQNPAQSSEFTPYFGMPTGFEQSQQSANHMNLLHGHDFNNQFLGNARDQMY